MKKDKRIFEELQQSLAGLDGSLYVLDTTIPIDKQMRYFRYTEEIRKRDTEKTLEEHIEMLNSNEATLKEMKDAMAFLAISGDVKAYRALENYSKETSDEDLNEWITLSLIQAKITLETEFSEEKRIFISTGLGGSGSKLRFFSFFKSTDLKPFSGYQRDLIEKEFSYFIAQSQGKTEEIKIEDNYFTLLFLIEFHTDIKNVLQRAVNECNQCGNFIDENFIITNVKVFDEEDIQRELKIKN